MFKITARTVLELGSELISSDIIAFYELIKNGFDAGTKTGVDIHFDIVLSQTAYNKLNRALASNDLEFETELERVKDALNKDATALYEMALKKLDKVRSIKGLIRALKIIYSMNALTVSDTGSGMSEHELESVFLVIGTASRKKDVQAALEMGAEQTPYLGEKGIGRLSAMRLGDQLKVHTARKKDAYFNILNIDWTKFDNLDSMLEDIDVAPEQGEQKPEKEWSGTDIIISGVTSDWTKHRLESMARDDFSLLTDPLVDQRKRKRIALYWNGERIAIPALDNNLLSHAHARITGRYEMIENRPRLWLKTEVLNLGFEHPKEIEIQELEYDDIFSLNFAKEGGLDLVALDTVGPFTFEAHWFNRRRLGQIDSIGNREFVKKLQEQWTGIRLYRDGLRVYPYGSEDDDWLSLDRRAMMSKGYTLNKIQFIGQVNISRASNPHLIDQTNREGLRQTPEQHLFLETLRWAIQNSLRLAMKRVEKQYKDVKVDLSGAKDQIKQLERRAKTAISKLKQTATPEERETIEDLQHTFFEFAEFASKARKRIEGVESDARQMIDMAGIGLMVEVVAHELARVSEDALDNLKALQGKQVPDEVKERLDSLRAAMKSISKRLRILDPMSVSGRQRAETFSLDELIEETFDAHKAQFDRHRIHVILNLPDDSIRVRVVKGMVVQVLENLLSNSTYWMALEKIKNPNFKPVLKVTLETNPVTILFEDNGPGITPANADKIFELFFSLKEKNKRRGLGLYIARECAEFNGGTLTLDNEKTNTSERLTQFIYTFSE